MSREDSLTGGRGVLERIAWSEQLPAVIQELQRRWSLSLGPPWSSDATCSWVAPAIWRDGTHVVLKLGMPHMEAEHEADGLRKVTGVSETDIQMVDSGDSMRIGNVEIEFLHTPGHTPGSQCFRVRNSLVSGDTLFIQGCGRVDLPGSDPDEMFHSLRKLASLPDDTVLYPGHDYGGGAHRTMAETKRLNAYLRIPNLEMWRELMGA